LGRQRRGGIEKSPARAGPSFVNATVHPVITAEQLEIYRHYNGDIDMFARSGNSAEKSVLSDDEWCDIRDLVQRVALENTGLAAERFSADTAELLRESCADEITAQKLRRIADEEETPRGR
jgi:hypothetical protein